MDDLFALIKEPLVPFFEYGFRVVNSARGLCSVEHAIKQGLFGPLEQQYCLDLATLQICQHFPTWLSLQPLIILSTNASLEQLCLLHTPGEAVQQDVSFSYFDIEDNSVLQDTLNGFLGYKLAVSHIGYDVNPLLQQYLVCPGSEKVADGQVRNAKVCDQSCALRAFANTGPA